MLAIVNILVVISASVLIGYGSSSYAIGIGTFLAVSYLDVRIVQESGHLWNKLLSKIDE